MKKKSLGFFLVLFTLSCTTQKVQLESTGYAVLTSPGQKNLLTNIKLQETADGVKMYAHATGLRPHSIHGFHIHEVGKCEGDFKSAGDHFNPSHNPHGGPSSKKRHAGDLGNLVADAKGEASAEVFIEKENYNSFGQFLGKSVILHAKVDDFISQPSGDSGERIACGIIVKSTQKD